MTDVDTFIDSARVESAIILDDIVSFDEECCAETGGGAGGCMKDAIVADTDVPG